MEYINITDVTNLKYQEKLGAKKKTFYTNRRDYAIFISLALLSSKYNYLEPLCLISQEMSKSVRAVDFIHTTFIFNLFNSYLSKVYMHTEHLYLYV